LQLTLAQLTCYVNVAAGTYTVDVTDANNCIETETAVIAEPTALQLSEVHVNESIAGANDGVINLAVNGGTTPYTYVWSHGPTYQDVNNLGPGTYNVVVTDANNCTANYSVTILPGNPPCTIPGGITANNIQNTSATLSWTPDSNVSNYLVEYRESGFNNWTGFNSAYAFAILNNLNSCTDYEVRIRASCAGGMSSVYSSIYTFTTDGCVLPCSTITGLFSQNVTNSSAFLVWDIVPNATYTMYYRAVGNASWFSYPSQFPLAILFQVSGPSPIANFTTVGANCKDQNGSPLVLENGQNSFNLHPNPATENIYISMDVSTTDVKAIKIFNAAGQVVVEEKIYGDNSIIDIADLPLGTYLCTLVREDSIESKVFVKQ